MHMRSQQWKMGLSFVWFILIVFNSSPTPLCILDLIIVSSQVCLSCIWFFARDRRSILSANFRTWRCFVNWIPNSSGSNCCFHCTQVPILNIMISYLSCRTLCFMPSYDTFIKLMVSCGIPKCLNNSVEISQQCYQRPLHNPQTQYKVANCFALL